MRRRSTLLLPICLACLFVGQRASANAVGSIMLLALESMGAARIARWMCATMFMCVSLEGVLYYHFRCVRRPLAMSLRANAISLLSGFILVAFTDNLLASLLPAAILGILVEMSVLSKAKSPDDIVTPAKFVLIVVSANVLTDTLLFGCLWVGHWKSLG